MIPEIKKKKKKIHDWTPRQNVKKNSPNLQLGQHEISMTSFKQTRKAGIK